MDKFKRVYIEISNICNLQCSFCPVVERDKKIMDVATFKHVLSEVAPKTEQITLHLMGEPLAHPQLPEILSLCQSQNVPINLTTNGILIGKYTQLLLESPSLYQMNFSLHSFKDNFKDRAIEPYLTEILNFSQIATKAKPELYINYRLWNVESDQDTCNEEILNFIEKTLEISIKRSVDVGSIKSKRIKDRIYLHFDTQFVWPSPHLPKISEKGRCHGLTGHIGIHADGEVVPCCLDKEAKLSLGNIKDNRLDEILNGDRALRIKAGFKTQKLVEDLCQRCSYVTRFQ